MATIKTANSVKIEVGTIYSKNGNKCAREQLWWDLPVDQGYNNQLVFTKFYFKTSNFDKVIFKNKNRNNNYIDKQNSNTLYLDGGQRKDTTSHLFSETIRQALFWMDTDENGQTTYEFADIFTPTAYIGEQNVEVATKYADNLECTF